MTNEDVLERAAKYDAYRAGGERDDPSTERLIDALAAEVRALRKDRERAKSEIEKAVELIQRWGCECEPQIGFTCGPCRVVEIIDAAMSREGEA